MGEQLASAEELRSNRIALGWRDNCSALLLPLQKCRHATLYAPWKCTDERHTYEKCQYDDFVDRMKQLSKQKSEAEE